MDVEFLSACCSGDTEKVSSILKNFTGNVNDIVDNKDQNGLHLACRSGNMEVALFLLEKECIDPQRTDSEGKRFLHHICGCLPDNFAVRLVEQLLAYVDDVNAADELGLSALHIACMNGSVNTIRSLLQGGNCDVNIFDKYGNTPLYFACKHVSDSKAANIVRLLCHYGADVNLLITNVCSETQSRLKLPNILRRGTTATRKKTKTTTTTVIKIACDRKLHESFVELLLQGTDEASDTEREMFNKKPLIVYYDGSGKQKVDSDFKRFSRTIKSDQLLIKVIFINVAVKFSDIYEASQSCKYLAFVGCTVVDFPVLKELEALCFYQCYLKNVQSGAQWEKLKTFVIKDTSVQSLRAWKFRDIESFVMTKTAITCLPESLQHARNLKKLLVCNNKLTKILERLPDSLEDIDVRFNNLKNLPFHVGFLPNLRSLRFNGNSDLRSPWDQLSTQPFDCVVDRIRSDLSNPEKDEKILKIVIVGDEKVNKNVLMNILNMSFVPGQESIKNIRCCAVDEGFNFMVYHSALDSTLQEGSLLLLSANIITICAFSITDVSLDSRSNPFGTLLTWLSNLAVKHPSALCILVGLHREDTPETMVTLVRDKIGSWISRATRKHKEMYEKRVDHCIMCSKVCKLLRPLSIHCYSQSVFCLIQQVVDRLLSSQQGRTT